MRTVLVVMLALALPSVASAADYALILGDSAVQSGVADRTALRAKARALALSHSAVEARVRAQGFGVLGSTELFVHALYVSASPDREAELRAIPGVYAVVKTPRVRRSLDKAIQLVNVPAAWNLLNGVSRAGLGIKIGIIDTGIEASHPAFQDSSLQPPAGFPICSGSDCAFTNNKIIVARSYVKYIAAGYVVDPSTSVDTGTDRPDDTSARDRDGHGTAVAMAAAGATNSGPSDTITGVAPKAYLGNYKVFGSPGVNDVSSAYAVNKALQDAFQDGMDIVVLSSGQPSLTGPLDSGSACGAATGTNCDAVAVSVDNAVKAGMLVVVSAGNFGATGSSAPLLQSVTSPGVAPNAISVAATTNSHNFYNAITVAGTTYQGNFGNGFLPLTPLTAPLADSAVITGDGSGCTTPNANAYRGVIVVMARGNCTFYSKVQNAVAGNALGVLFVNNPGDNSYFVPGGLNGTPIPSFLVGYDDGQSILELISSGVTATLDPVPVATPAVSNLVAPFSSRGPVTGSLGLKPDIAAPGTGIYLAGETYDPNGALYSSTGYVFGDGTSFAAPIVAGAAALVKQAHPAMSAVSIRSSVINTATQDVTENGSPASVLAVGAGKLNAAAAINNNLIISPATIAFGVVKALPVTQKIQLTNIGATPLTIAVAIARRTAENNAKTSIDLPNLTVPPGLTSTINFSLTGSVPTPGIYEGLITIQGAAGPLVIPYVYQVGDGVPYNISAIYGDGDEGNVNQYPSGQAVALKVVDKYGLPVAQYPVKFGVVAGGGKVIGVDPTTDNYGIAYATPVLGPTPGTNVFYGSAGSLTVSFTDTGRLPPTITAAANAASFEQKAVSPGSYLVLVGTGLSDVTQVAGTLPLPLVLGGVTVSFDSPGVSVPGRLYYVSPGQISVLVPWELAGQSSAQVKVSVGYSFGVVFPLALAPVSPGVFEYAAGKQLIAAALDENYALLGPTNPALQGHGIQLYCNGLGAVSNTPASGAVAPSSPLAMTTATPTVTIGGKTAQVSFSGLTPSTVGLYQLNVVVPATGAGLQPVVVSVGGVTAKTSQVYVQ